jgi:hypothetical protein
MSKAYVPAYRRGRWILATAALMAFAAWLTPLPTTVWKAVAFGLTLGALNLLGYAEARWHPLPALILALALATAACDPPETEEQRAARAWAEPCHDESTLLATTAGSPDHFRCPNRRHRMQVQVATTGSNEEAAALVFCRCANGDADAEAVSP